MTLDQLKQFLFAAKYESFTVAAEHLFTHPSTVSRNVCQLETDIGFSLFDRTNRGIHLNEAGRFLMDEVDFLLAALNDAIAQAGNIEKRAGSKLVIRLGETMYANVSRLFRAFLTEYPTAFIDLDFYSYVNGLDVCRQLDERTIDLYFGYNDNIPSYSVSAWNLRKVYSDAIGVIVGNHHRLAGRDTVSIKDLEQENVFGSNFHDYDLEHELISAMKKAGHNSKSIRFINGLDSKDLHMRTSAGLGVSFMPLSNNAAAGWDCRIIPLSDFHYEKPVYMIWRSDNANPTLQRFLEMSWQVLAENDDKT